MSQVKAERKEMLNGLDIITLNQLVQTLKHQDQAGQITFRGQTRRREDGLSATHFDGYQFDGEMARTIARSMTLEADEPVELGGRDRAPAPSEALLHALGACIADTADAYAAMMGVTLTRLSVSVEGDLDLHGRFGLGKNARPGFQQIRLRLSIAGNADSETLKNIASAGYQYSVVRDTVAKSVDLLPSIEVIGQ